jgi:hypothetical protein
MTTPDTTVPAVATAPVEKRVIRRRKLEDLINTIGERYFSLPGVPDGKLLLSVETAGDAYTTAVVNEQMALVFEGKGKNLAEALVDTLRGVVEAETASDAEAEAIRKLEEELAAKKLAAKSKKNILSDWKGFGKSGGGDEAADAETAEAK